MVRVSGQGSVYGFGFRLGFGVTNCIYVVVMVSGQGVVEGLGFSVGFSVTNC